MRIPVVLLAAVVLVGPARAESPDAVKSAVEKGLRRLEEGAANYTKNRQCFSCHHQAVPMAAFASARRHGFTVDEEEIQHQIEFTINTFRPDREKIAKGQGVGGTTTSAGYALFTLEMGGSPPDDDSAALVEYLLTKQRTDGSWPVQSNRPPMQAGDFTPTYLALRALKAYGPAEDAKDADELRRRVDAAYEKGRQWMISAKAKTTEDETMRLRALVFVRADQDVIDAARDALCKEQREDGGWAQQPDRASDAYAAGTALTALSLAGVKPEEEVYQRGVQYLLKTQRDDGGWVVETHSPPVQRFFDNGDPGGKSQFISFSATAWAVMALLEASPPPDARKRQ
ncbi:MAG TPA: prenyltransferase/squalene oxidase repeat-containing protein [Gemmataceae bacterium]|nr:prenyltransferase/squalene oxidase repeat-containing protein [Gemmataceae bacterium]